MKLHHMLFCTKLWLVKIFAQERYNRYFQLKFRLDTNKPTFTQLLVALERLRRYRLGGISGKTDYATVYLHLNKTPYRMYYGMPFDSFVQLLHDKYTNGFEGIVVALFSSDLRFTLYPPSAENETTCIEIVSLKNDNTRLLYHAKRLNKLWPITLH